MQKYVGPYILQNGSFVFVLSVSACVFIVCEDA